MGIVTGMMVISIFTWLLTDTNILRRKSRKCCRVGDAILTGLFAAFFFYLGLGVWPNPGHGHMLAGAVFLALSSFLWLGSLILACRRWHKGTTYENLGGIVVGFEAELNECQEDLRRQFGRAMSEIIWTADPVDLFAQL